MVDVPRALGPFEILLEQVERALKVRIAECQAAGDVVPDAKIVGVEEKRPLGRMKASRGHQSAGTSSPERDATKIAAAGKKAFVWQPAMKLDYFEIVDPETLEPVDAVNKRVLVAVAAFVGNTRLIDNILLEP